MFALGNYAATWIVVDFSFLLIYFDKGSVYKNCKMVGCNTKELGVIQ